jgi:hypothetical protein
MNRLAHYAMEPLHPPSEPACRRGARLIANRLAGFEIGGAVRAARHLAR